MEKPNDVRFWPSFHIHTVAKVREIRSVRNLGNLMVTENFEGKDKFFALI